MRAVPVRGRPVRLAIAALAAGMALSACATSKPVKPTARAPARPAASQPVTPAKPPADSARVTPPRLQPTGPAVSLTRLHGWEDEDHLAGLEAFRDGCGASRDTAVRAVCARARALGRVDGAEARRFLENHFEAQPMGDGGVLTAYFAPEYEARDRPDAEFNAPVRPRPSGLVAASVGSTTAAPQTLSLPDLGDVEDPIALALRAGEAQIETAQNARSTREARRQASAAPRSEWIDLARADRATIERSAPNGALAWMRAEDLFFLQIQGSGVLTFPDGRRMKAAYTADNGKPFVAIARPMVERGIFQPNRASGDAIRSWLAANRGARADAVMQLNPRYIFFTLSRDDGREPAGAAGIPLTAGRAIAVDPSRHAYGDLYWIDAEAPILAGAFKVYRRLAMALDTGSAIRGQVRADLYLGRGDAAGQEAGRVRHTLKMVRLKPIDPARSARHEADAAARGG